MWRNWRGIFERFEPFELNTFKMLTADAKDLMCVVINLFRWSFFASICRLFARWRWLNQTWWHELSIRLLVNQRRHLANRRTSQSYGPCFILLAVTRAPPTYHLIYFTLKNGRFPTLLSKCFPPSGMTPDSSYSADYGILLCLCVSASLSISVSACPCLSACLC